MSRKKQLDDQRRAEALRAIHRVQAESESLGSSSFRRMADRASSHLRGADKDQDDQIEVWGTRIGRTAGVIFALGLLIYLAATYL